MLKAINSEPHFEAPEHFNVLNSGYEILPFRFARIPGRRNQVLLTSYVGEYIFITEKEFEEFRSHKLKRDRDIFHDLKNRQFLCDPQPGPYLEGIAAQHRTRKYLAAEDPGLHIFVLTLRCDHKCIYCQVTPQSQHATGFDMSSETAQAALDRVFESSAPWLTIEFQGGEASLSFERLKEIVITAEAYPKKSGQQVRFVIATNVHLLSDEMLMFCREHSIEISTSLDGPPVVHDANRIFKGGDSYKRTVDGIARAREACGADHVNALATITRHSLPHAKATIDTYVSFGFRTISLRPITPLGFAARSKSASSYGVEEYLDFYREALDYLIELNLAGVSIQETYASLLLTRILTPFPTPYVDLQSPAAAGTAVVTYNYNGDVYVSDEARMLAEMGDRRFRMGSVSQPMSELQKSEAMHIVRQAGIAEELPTCKDCAFVPYCGADPVMHVATQGDPIGDKNTSEFCLRHTGLFRILFGKLAERDPDTMRVFLSWIRNVDLAAVPHAGYMR